MSDSKKVYSASERVRRAYLNLITGQKPRPDPGVDSGMDDLVFDKRMLADEQSGLLFRKFTIEASGGPADPAEPFILQVPLWVRTERDNLRIEHSSDSVTWTTVHDETRDFRDPSELDPYPVEIVKSQDPLRVDGVHYFRSWVKNSDDDISFSTPLKFLFDRDPPYSKQPPPKFPDIPAVTDASLAANGNAAHLELPAYNSWADGDQVLVYWMNRLPEKIEDLDPPIVTLPTTGAAQVLPIPGDKIRAVGDGGVYVLYVLVDKALNVSAWSVWTSIPVALGELPVTFADPVVPLATAEDNYLIDQADAHLGVQVWVPWQEQMKATDTVVVTWGGKALTAETVGSATEEYIPVRVPNDVMLEAYGNGTGPVPTNVSYLLMRGTHPVGGADTEIFVDFETMDPGGPDPEWPLPIHPDLKDVVVRGGGATGNDNELDADDAGLPADLHVELYIFAQEDDVIKFYWAGEFAAEYTVSDTDQPGDEITVSVPWSIIKEGGNNPALRVDYVASRPGVHNPVRSDITLVSVDAITITPVEATFAHLNSNGRISCASIQATNKHPDGPAVEVLIPDLTEYYQFSAFTQIQAEWWVYRGETDNEGFDIIDAVTLEPVIDIDDNHPVTGFTWRIPFETNVLPTDEGLGGMFNRSRANVRYTLKTDKGDIASADAKVTLSFIPPSGVCDPAGGD